MQRERAGCGQDGENAAGEAGNDDCGKRTDGVAHWRCAIIRCGVSSPIEPDQRRHARRSVVTAAPVRIKYIALGKSAAATAEDRAHTGARKTALGKRIQIRAPLSLLVRN